jgi:PBP1b-binding outer membrane lipoprotein LpoB
MKIRNISITLAALTLCALVIVSCTVPYKVVSTRPDGSKETNTVHQVDPRLTDVIETGKPIASVLPQPVGWISAFGLALAGAIGQSVASYKNKKEAIANGQEAFKWEDVATTIIQGVDSLGTQAKAVKDAIKARSITDGNHDVIRDIVAEETKSVT